MTHTGRKLRARNAPPKNHSKPKSQSGSEAPSPSHSTSSSSPSSSSSSSRRSPSPADTNLQTPSTPASPEEIHPESDQPISPLNLTVSESASKETIYTTCTAFLTSSSEHHIIFLSKRHPIIIPRLIQQTFNPLTVTATRTQAFKITFHSQADRDAALAVKSLGEFPVKVALPQSPSKPKHTTSAITQQHNKVVIHGISTAIKPDEVKNLTKANFVKPLSRSMDGDFVSYLLDYDTTPPASIQIAYTRHTTHPYIPQPLRCDKCQHFGHTTKTCRTKAVTCSFCSGPHSYQECDRKSQQGAAKCTNCGGNHSAAYRSCPKYQQIAAILSTKIKNNISYAEAAAKHKTTTTQQTPSITHTDKQTHIAPSHDSEFPSLPPPQIPPPVNAPTPVHSIVSHPQSSASTNVPHYQSSSPSLPSFSSSDTQLISLLITLILSALEKIEGGGVIADLVRQVSKLIIK